MSFEDEIEFPASRVAPLTAAEERLARLPTDGRRADARQQGAREVRTVPFSEVKLEVPKWLWRPRIPHAALTLLLGDPYLGKSLLSCWLAARLTTGDLTGMPGVVLFSNVEDSYAARVKPRLIAAGANLERVYHFDPRLDGAEDGLWIPDDLPHIEEQIAHRGADLLVIDPVMAHLPEKIDSHKDQSVRRALAPLQRIAEEHDTAVLGLIHPNKSLGREVLRRSGGSMGFQGAARSGLLLARDPDDPEGEDGRRRVLAQTGNNYGDIAPSLLFEVQPVLVPAQDTSPEVETARITEVGVSDYTSSQLLDVPKDPGDSEADARDARVVAFVAEHDGTSQKKIEDGVGGKRDLVRESLGRLLQAGRLIKQDPEKNGLPTKWRLGSRRGDGRGGEVPRRAVSEAAATSPRQQHLSEVRGEVQPASDTDTAPPRPLAPAPRPREGHAAHTNGHTPNEDQIRDVLRRYPEYDRPDWPQSELERFVADILARETARVTQTVDHLEDT
jgi:AAA domain-containing protein